jgi:spore coat protein U-like protein
MKTLTALVAALVLTAAPLASFADTTTGLSVDATVNAECTAQGGGAHFGIYDPLIANRSVALETYGAIFLTCTKGSNVGINYTSANQMTSGSNKLNYTIDNADTAKLASQTWGINNQVTFNFHDVIAAGQDVAVGYYSDSPVITITF